MARDRQRAKQRQAERRAARLRDRGDKRPKPGTPAVATDGSEAEEEAVDPTAKARIATEAPPEETGRSDTVVESPPPALVREEEDLEEIAADDEPRARPGGRPREEPKERGRVAGFLVAVWAELQRVQWPNRQALTTLTGIVLGFVLIAGGYLGLLDAIFSRLIQAIL